MKNFRFWFHKYVKVIPFKVLQKILLQTVLEELSKLFKTFLSFFSFSSLTVSTQLFTLFRLPLTSQFQCRSILARFKMCRYFRVLLSLNFSRDWFLRDCLRFLYLDTTSRYFSFFSFLLFSFFVNLKIQQI